MNTLPEDVLLDLLVQINLKEAVSLSHLDNELGKKVSKIISSNDFWKRKTEILVNKSLQTKSSNWKKIYFDLLKLKRDEWLVELSKEGNREALEVVLELDIKKGFDNAIRQATAKGYIEVIKLLLRDKRVDPGASSNYLIGLASREGDIEVIKLLLQDKRVDPSDGNNNAIQTASLNGHIEIVRLLMQDKRVDPSADNNLAIRWASENKHTKIVKLLLQDPRVKETIH